MKRLLTIAAAITLVGCTDADIASSNLSKAADQFEINRRVVFYNGITGGYILAIEGLRELAAGSHHCAGCASERLAKDAEAR